jgi:uncharacterized membrane protein (UPF0127 family)
MKGRLVALELGLLLIASCTGSASSSSSPPAPLARGTLLVRTQAGSVPLAVQIAGTEAARRRGLMGRRSLAPDAGMVFLFPGPVRDGFWMKDTLIPLSIGFWDANDRIVATFEMVPCRTDPCPLYTPSVSYVGAAEANRGWFTDHGVSLGDTVELEGAVSRSA